MKLTQQRGIVPEDFPFDIYITRINGYPPHWHSALEIVSVLDGEVLMSVNDRQYHLNTGDLLLLNPGDVHYFHHQKSSGKRYIIQLEPTLLGPLEYLATEHRFEKNSLFQKDLEKVAEFRFVWDSITELADLSREFKNQHVIERQPLLHYLRNTMKKRCYPDFSLDTRWLSLKHIERKFLEHSLQPPLWKDELVQRYRLAVMSPLFRLLSGLEKLSGLSELSESAVNRQQQILGRLRDLFLWVENNYRNPISLDDAAEAVHLSKYHFSRFFRNATGVTFLRFITDYRLSMAVNSLLHSSDSIAEIATDSGFGNVKTFHRVFREAKGMSPGNFRKSNI